jgi:hypothetical protein
MTEVNSGEEYDACADTVQENPKTGWTAGGGSFSVAGGSSGSAGTISFTLGTAAFDGVGDGNASSPGIGSGNSWCL